MMIARQQWGCRPMVPTVVPLVLAVLVAAALLLLPASLAAQRTIDADADKQWVHDRTGFGFPATLADLPRVRIVDFSDGLWDVAALYETPSRNTILTVYAYRTAMWSAPANFAVAQRSILSRAKAQPGFFGNLNVLAGPSAFATQAGGVASGIRITYAAGGGTYKATALAVVPFTTQWTFKIRFTSGDMDAAEMDAVLNKVIATLAWPKDAYRQIEAAPIGPCPEATAFDDRAKPVAGSGMQSLAMLSIIAGATPTTNSTPSAYCLIDADVGMGVFRRTTSADHYYIAVGDNGTTIRAARTASFAAADADAKPGTGEKNAASYDVDLLSPGKITLFATYDGLPAANAALRAARGRPVGTIALPKPGEKGPTVIIAAPPK